MPTAEQFEQFYEPLVGSKEAVAAFQSELTDIVAPATSAAEGYDSLRSGTTFIIRETVEVCVRTLEEPDRRDLVRWRTLRSNGIFGANTAIAALQAVGDAYGKYAVVPQDEQVVRRSMHHAIGRVFGVAHSGSVIGLTNMVALREGLNPRNPLHYPFMLTSVLANDQLNTDFHKGFVPQIDESTGQIDVRPRHQRLKRALNRQCPASFASSDTERGKKASLYVFLSVIGDVAMSEIYPKQFDIAPSVELT